MALINPFRIRLDTQKTETETETEKGKREKQRRDVVNQKQAKKTRKRDDLDVPIESWYF